MGRAIDFWYDAMLKLDKDVRNILDEQLMFNIFKPLKIKPLDKYFKYIFDFFKLRLLVTQENILGKETKKEFSHPNHEKNKATSSLVVKLGAELEACLIKEILDPTKLTSQHLSSKGRWLSWGLSFFTS